MRQKYEKNQDFPLVLSGDSKLHQSKVLESLRENYHEQVLMQTSAGSSTRNFEDFLVNQEEKQDDRDNLNEQQLGTFQDREASPDSMIKSFSQLVQEHGKAGEGAESYQKFDNINSQYQAIQLNKQGSNDSDTRDKVMLGHQGSPSLLKSSDLFSKEEFIFKNPQKELQKHLKDHSTIKIQQLF